MATISVIIPTLGRSTLNRSVSSIQAQTEQSTVLIKMGNRGFLEKVREATNDTASELIGLCDDDAIYPPQWVSQLSKVFDDPSVGAACGPMYPLIDGSSTNTERRIAEVNGSRFGALVFRKRFKSEGEIMDKDESELIGSGLYRRDILSKILNEEWDKIAPSGWETYVFTRMRAKGYKTLHVPSAYFYHRQRATLPAFIRQICKSGVGRMNYFKQFPSQVLRKWFTFLPIAVFAYTFVFPFSILYLPLIIPFAAYVLTTCAVSYGFSKHRSFLLPFYYYATHFSYGMGMMMGLFKKQRRWK